MNSTQLDSRTEQTILLAQHISGSVTFIFNIIVFMLILSDDDSRNRGFRKYICVLVISSLTLDSFSDLYAPIVLFNQGILYSDSLLSHAISAAAFYAIFLTILGEVVAAYFACVYYRWSVVMPNERRWNFHGWKRIVLYLIFQIFLIMTLSGSLYFYRKAFIAAEHSLPPELNWVRSHATYAFAHPDQNVDYANYVAMPTAALFVTIVFGILSQLISELKRGMSKSSSATRRQDLSSKLDKLNGCRYQMMAVRSLVLQGVVPSFIYVIPSLINTCFEINICDRNTSFATVLSPILWIIITKHTFANSLTILYCTPSYRAKLLAFAPTKLSEIMRLRKSSNALSSFPRTTTVRP